MKNYAFHLAQKDIPIRMLRMAMVIGTIGKAEVNFMGVILGELDGFVNGSLWSRARGKAEEQKSQPDADHPGTAQSGEHSKIRGDQREHEQGKSLIKILKCRSNIRSRADKSHHKPNHAAKSGQTAGENGEIAKDVQSAREATRLKDSFS